MSDNLSEQLEKVIVWHTKIYRGCLIEGTENGYLVFGKPVKDMEEAHKVIDESFKDLEDSLVATKLL